MEQTANIYQDIVSRTGGDVYIGVVGPVRTGKSTFIKRFMETLVLPHISDGAARTRAMDEMPQSGSGRTVMTAEPKFIPAEAVQISLPDAEGAEIAMRVRLVDCVGFAVEGALGFVDEEGPRMVDTPWSEEPISFEQAAAIGTEKVITERSTMGVVVLSDGSFGDIDRSAYQPAEQRVIDELRGLDKPFVIVLNSRRPDDDETRRLADELSERAATTVLPLDVSHMDEDDVADVLTAALYEFPLTAINVAFPRWIEQLENEHWLRQSLNAAVGGAATGVSRVRDINSMIEQLRTHEQAEKVRLSRLDLGSGVAALSFQPPLGLFWQILSEYARQKVESEADLLPLLRDSLRGAREWSKVEAAIREAADSGYGVIEPQLEEMSLEEPELIRTGGHFGVRLRASAPGYHVIRTNVSTEVTPLVGTEKQCAELARYITEEFEDDPARIWNTDVFGKSLHELVSEGIAAKIGNLPPQAQEKLAQTLQRIVNEQGGGIICIIL